MSEDAPVAKRPRRSKDDDKDEAPQRELFLTLWQHWQAYLASTEAQEDDPESTPDTDELMEMLEIGRREKIPVLSPPPAVNEQDTTALVNFYVEAWKKPWDLIPILLSVAANVLADDAIALYLEQKSNAASDDNALSLSAPRDYLEQALTWFPANASTWSMLANWVRMTQVLEQQALDIAKLHRYAAHQANILRRAGLQILSQYNDQQEEDGGGGGDDDDDEAIPALPTIVEGLLLNQVVGVEYEAPEEEEEKEEDEEEEETDAAEMKSKDNEEEQWSTSAIEGTSRFMAAMQLSMAGYHDEAIDELRHFNLSHRLHPNVWDKTKAIVSKIGAMPPITKEPVLFSEPVLPRDVHEKLLQLFAPDAPYWIESGYSQRGYYSFFVHRLQKDQMPKDFIQDAIKAFLLPLVEKKLPPDSAPIVGYEWWVHTRPLTANLGHNLHFDTDEALLKQEQEVTHPVISSVLYLDGTEDPGPTIVLNQSSDISAPNADMIWRNDPSPNSYLLFPGNLLHGVLPCGVFATMDANKLENRTGPDITSAPDFKKYLSNDTGFSVRREESHRLSFMVGFWTRSVPDKMKDPTRLYGPCSPMPPDTDFWVKQAQEGYPRAGFRAPSKTPDPRSVPRVSPAWQLLPDNKLASKDHLEIPKALDHRYFVLDPLNCFRESLFERQGGESEGEDERHQMKRSKRVSTWNKLM